MRAQIRFPLIVALVALLGLGASRNFAVDIDLIGGSGLKIGGTAVIDSSRAATVSALVSTGAISGTTGTFSDTLATSRFLTAAGAVSGTHAAKAVLDYNTGNARLFGRGPDITTNAGIVLYSQRSDGSNSLVLWTGNSDGTSTFGTSAVSMGALTATTGTFTGGVNPNASGGQSIANYLEGTFTGTLTDVTATATASFTYVRVGKIVTLSLNAALVGTSNAGGCTITGMPATIRPSGAYVATVAPVVDNGNTAMGYMAIDTAGVINLGVSLTGAQGFTSSGIKGVDHFLVTYPIGS